MSVSNSVFPALRRLLPLIAALILFSGCQTPRPPVAIITPPPPPIGSAPIAAYDAYAWAVKPQLGTPRSDKMILISSR